MGITVRLDDGSMVSDDSFAQRIKMPLNQNVGIRVADPFVEGRRSLQVREEIGQVLDGQRLLAPDGFGAKDGAEGLVAVAAGGGVFVFAGRLGVEVSDGFGASSWSVQAIRIPYIPAFPPRLPS